MRVISRLFLFAILMFSMSAVHAQYSFEAGGFYYNILSQADSTVEVTYGENEYSGDIVIPNTVLHGDTTYYVVGVGDEAFRWDEFVSSVTFGENIRSIGTYAFAGNPSLLSIVIPDRVTELKKGCFGGCSHLTNIHIGEGVDSIPESAFSGSSVKELHIGSNVKYIGDKAFQGKSGKLSEIVIPQSVKYIGKYAFSHHMHVTSLDLGAVEQIEECAFSHLFALEELILPSTLKTIGTRAFMQCSALEKIHIPASVTLMEANPFQYCNSIYSITVDDANGVYDSRNGCNAIIRTNTDCIITACKTTVIPNETKYFASFSFSNKSITGIEIPDSLLMIQANTFYETPLEYVGVKDLVTWMRIDFSNISSNPTNITGSLMVDGQELTHLIVPDEVTTIKRNTFANLKNLTKVELHKDLQLIDAYAFNGTTNIKEVITYAPIPFQMYSASFTTETYQNAILYVPAGTKELYSADYYWNWHNFKNIVEMVDTGIDSLQTENSVKEIYSIDGKKRETIGKGVNIVRYINGESKKIYVK